MPKVKGCENALTALPAGRREFVKRILAVGAFAAPVVASFTIDALTARSAQAQEGNATPTPTPTPGPSPTPLPPSAILMGTAAVGLGINAYRNAKRGKKTDGPTAAE